MTDYSNAVTLARQSIPCCETKYIPPLTNIVSGGESC
nr:MAG TPA_asm: hypothetical protein [Caudoviricetes sp.]